MRKTKLFLLLGVGAVFSLSQAFANPDKVEEGEFLYKYHGCKQCHGDQGKKPASKLAPVLAGQKADQITAKASKIFSGENTNEGAVFMHAKYYSPSALTQACDEAPNKQELATIANWLSVQK